MVNATPTVASPTISDLRCAIPDSPIVVHVLKVMSTKEVGPLKRYEEPTRDQNMPPPPAEASGGLVHVGSDPLAWGGPTLTWMDEDGKPFFVLNDVVEREMWSEFQTMAQVSGSYFVRKGSLLMKGLMISSFFF